MFILHRARMQSPTSVSGRPVAAGGASLPHATERQQPCGETTTRYLAQQHPCSRCSAPGRVAVSVIALATTTRIAEPVVVTDLSAAAHSGAASDRRDQGEPAKGMPSRTAAPSLRARPPPCDTSGPLPANTPTPSAAASPPPRQRRHVAAQSAGTRLGRAGPISRPTPHPAGQPHPFTARHTTSRELAT